MLGAHPVLHRDGVAGDLDDGVRGADPRRRAPRRRRRPARRRPPSTADRRRASAARPCTSRRARARGRRPRRRCRGHGTTAARASPTAACPSCERSVSVLVNRPAMPHMQMSVDRAPIRSNGAGAHTLRRECGGRSYTGRRFWARRTVCSASRRSLRAIGASAPGSIRLSAGAPARDQVRVMGEAHPRDHVTGLGSASASPRSSPPAAAAASIRSSVGEIEMPLASAW